MDKNGRLANEFSDQHVLYMTLAQKIMAKQNAHEFFIEVLATMLLTCLPEDSQRNFVTDLHALNAAMLQSADALKFDSPNEKQDATMLARVKSEHIGRILDRSVERRAANPATR